MMGFKGLADPRAVGIKIFTEVLLVKGIGSFLQRISNSTFTFRGARRVVTPSRER